MTPLLELVLPLFLDGHEGLPLVVILEEYRASARPSVRLLIRWTEVRFLRISRQRNHREEPRYPLCALGAFMGIELGVRQFSFDVTYIVQHAKGASRSDHDRAARGRPEAVRSSIHEHPLLDVLPSKVARYFV